MDELITTREAAAMLGIKHQSLRKRVMKGLDPQPVRRHPGYCNMFKKTDVLRLLTSRNKRA